LVARLENDMRNLRLILSYDGSEFAGWQVQPGLPTIQGMLSTVLGRLTGENVLPQGSGRTDAGVHALAQVVTFATASPIPLGNWRKVLNDNLPPSIRVLEVSEAPADFHARKSAQAKTYRYRVYRADVCPPFLAKYVWHYPFPLIETAMSQAAGVIVGKHDFTSFAAVDPERVERIAEQESTVQAGRQESPGEADHGLNNVRTVFSSQWARDGEEFVYTVRGNGFLHHMVRNLVGTFLLVGKGTLDCEALREILSARDRSSAGATAPASGLYLVGVEY